MSHLQSKDNCVRVCNDMPLTEFIGRILIWLIHTLKNVALIWMLIVFISQKHRYISYFILHFKMSEGVVAGADPDPGCFQKFGQCE